MSRPTNRDVDRPSPAELLLKRDPTTMSGSTLASELAYVNGDVLLRVSHADSPPTIIGPHSRDGHVRMLATGHHRVGDAGCRIKTPTGQLIIDELDAVAIDAIFVAEGDLDETVRDLWRKHQEGRL